MATIDLCTVDDVLRSPMFQEYQDGTTEPAADLREYMQQAILAVSDEAEAITGRWLKRDTYTEVLDVELGWRVLQLRAYPVVSVTSVILGALDGTFPAGNAFAATDYALLQQGRSGQLGLRLGAIGLAWGVASVRVVYVGGLSALPENLSADLRLAAVEQVAYVVRRASTAHLTSEAQQGGSATYYRATPLLPSVACVFDRYRLMC
jgi:hypothetical protein